MAVVVLAEEPFVVRAPPPALNWAAQAAIEGLVPLLLTVTFRFPAAGLLLILATQISEPAPSELLPENVSFV